MKTFTPAYLTSAALILLATAISTTGAVPAGAAPAAPTGFPFTDEDLNYSINWPSGIGLGEAHLHAKHSGANWNFSFTLEAGVPGFAVKDSYHSDAVPDLCSTVFDRNTSHGSHEVKDRETIDRDHGTATGTSQLKGGGNSEMPVPACVKDALTYLFYSRREMGQGRVPAAQEILFGGLYAIRADYTGAPVIPVAGKQVQSDQVTYSVTTHSSGFHFDVYFARDPARTPLLISVPFSLGTFSMELLR